MSPQETQVLQNFLDQLVKVQGISKDVQAQSLINDAVSKQPDASYLLVQRALLLDQALAQANSQITSLQTELRELQASKNNGYGSSAGNFLDPATSAWGNSSSSRPIQAATAATTATSVTGSPLPGYSGMQPPPLPVSTMAATPASSFFGGTGGSMLGTVAATAAGVAAGAFLFQGIGHLMGNQSHQQMADSGNGAAQLNQGGGDLLPGYFDKAPEVQETAPEVPAVDDTQSASLTDDFGDDDMADFS
ncbi:DUF2076 domain-containing protein [Undibacterium sp. Ji50W]|uniref:DUF2076 domain-containing protein n=1 Tax=Undibacterium sp. Ji50W TaxID=3413041 RepID=UPI003BF17818